ncbi:MAG: YncE family protein [Chitinophagaceae bacterium]|nr:MAG: YncE family protein [Chitinophagaceae bacterium]
MNTKLIILLITCSYIFFTSCRKDKGIIMPESTPSNPQISNDIIGMYILNEGNMNSNMSSLDFYNYSNGTYFKNIYNAANPSSTLGLGDVGNDILIYGSKMYIIVNASNKLEILDAYTAKRIKKIDIKNGRYISASNGKIYVSSYGGEIEMGTQSPNGFVAEIDTTTLSISRTVNVGRQPEQLTIVNNKLYVANSGGYSPPHYERTVSVIDINSFKVIKAIDVAINLHKLQPDSKGNLYVSSRGDFYQNPSNLFLINTQKDIVTDTFNIEASNFTISGDSVYVISSGFNYTSGGNIEAAYQIINTQTKKMVSNSFIKDGTQKDIQIPYGISVDPINKNIYISDAKDYVSSGVINVYDKNGKRIQSFTAGNIPTAFSFLYKSIIK